MPQYHIHGLLNADNSHWLTDNHLLWFQTFLLEGPIIQIQTCSTFNLATFLPDTEEELTHDSQQVLIQTYAAIADLQETPLDNPDRTLITDGSSFIENDTWKAGYAIVTLYNILEKASLPSGASTQLAELITHLSTRAE